jgi:hypothetical protein
VKWGRAPRASLGVGITLGGVGLGTTAAGAKALPVTQVRVTTASPTASEPITVVVRMRRGFDLGDGGWERAETTILPVARTDAHGWPLDQTRIHGAVVPLHRVGVIVAAALGASVTRRRPRSARARPRPGPP